MFSLTEYFFLAKYGSALQPETSITYVSRDYLSYKSFGPSTAGSCSAACFLEPQGQCHFYVVKSGGTCYLGHVTNATNGNANPTGSWQYHFITGDVTNARVGWHD